MPTQANTTTTPRRIARAALAAAIAAAGLAATAATTGCGLAYKPYYHESGSGAAIDQYTYVSRPWEPKTITLIDVRTNEPVWTVDVPVGKQLTMRFYEDKNPENTTTPDSMRWQIQDEGTKFGHMANTTLVPPAEVRRIDVELRAVPEAPPEDF